MSVTKRVSLIEAKSIVSAKRSYADAVTGALRTPAVVSPVHPIFAMPVGVVGAPPFFLVW